MKAEQAQLRDLLTQTIVLMCRNGLEFSRNVRVEGLLAVTVDGTDIFVIHMDERVTDRPSYASSSRCTESSTGHQRESASAATVPDADDVCVHRVNDGCILSQSAAVSDKYESSCALPIDSVYPVKTEPDVEDSDDDVMIMEPDVKSLMSSSIPLPVVEGMKVCEHSSPSYAPLPLVEGLKEYEDNGPSRLPLSPLSRKRRAADRISLGDLPASVCSASVSDDQIGDAHYWSSSASYAPNGSNIHIPQTAFSYGDTDYSLHAGTHDVSSHTSFLSTSGSQALVPVSI